MWVHAARPFLKYNTVTKTKFTAPHAMAETHSRSALCGCETFDIVHCSKKKLQFLSCDVLSAWLELKQSSRGVGTHTRSLLRETVCFEIGIWRLTFNQIYVNGSK